MPRLFRSDAEQTNPDQRQLIDVSKSKKLTLNILKNLKESVLDYKALKKASEKLIGNRQSATRWYASGLFDKGSLETTNR